MIEKCSFLPKNPPLWIFFSKFFLTVQNLTSIQTNWDQQQVNTTFLYGVMTKSTCNSEKYHFFSNFCVRYEIPPSLSSTRQNWKLKLYTGHVCTLHAKFQTVLKKYLVPRTCFVKAVGSNFIKIWRYSLHIRHYGFEIKIFFTNSYFLIHNTHNCQILDRSYL